jgi:ABC-2 type transport system permease protein/oleandomycin transport system permease protein
MAEITIPPPPVRSAPLTFRLALRDIGGMTKRNLLRIIRTPQLLFVSVLQPAIILLLFRYVLGGAIKVPGLDYVDFVVPGIFLEAVLIGGMTTALALAQDLQAGMIDRFRSLPMARSAFLAGRTLADLSRSALSLAFMIALGLLAGFRFHNGVVAPLAGVALIIAFGYALTWVYAAVDLAVKDPQTAQMTAILPMFILFFASSALVPVSTMPGWLQPFAQNQPATVTINAVRALLEGGPVYHDLWQSLLWCMRIFIVFLVVSLNLYRKATA